VEWFCNIEGHARFEDRSDFLEHMELSHDVTFNIRQSSLLGMFQHPPRGHEGPCNFCSRTSANLKSHVSRHLEQIALFSIPSSHDRAEDKPDVSEANSEVSQRNLNGSVNKSKAERWSEGSGYVIPNTDEAKTDNLMDEVIVPDTEGDPWAMLKGRFAPAEKDLLREKEPGQTTLEEKDPETSSTSNGRPTITEYYSATPSQITDQNLQYKRLGEFLAALTPPEYFLFRCRVEEPARGTITWFLNESTFTSWVSVDNSSLLSIRGPPGHGKTVISKFLLDHLDHQYGDLYRQNIVLYFFFSNGDKNLRTVNALLRSLVDQLLRTRGLIGSNTELAGILDSTEDFIKEMKSDDTLWQIFSSLVKGSGLSRVYLIVDGLDECEDMSNSIGGFRRKLLRWMKSMLYSHQKPVVKLLVTTRPIVTVLDELEGFPYVDHELRFDDLRAFVDEKIATLPMSSGLGLRHRLAKIHLENPSSTFYSVLNMVDKLKEIPPSSPAMLESMISKIERRPAESGDESADES
jgi:hypothetical protein